ncbi:hypothetical protein A3D11_02120 [Candidatus Peribacteria bacterium RIFCSPHIGHO2_02_FULL_49_16]|nr:MAG: hypothetical protein A2880_02945 [Candidatus Peribacteria bacterium RIFCSPHIGHO2_01_FULL_49_38]OGJ60183.1 MAG: hypothetical protein A3D11_02120 [Candidatus Peribacteria bacterium RIFCSPHIGHO2_02_FULL_49_16]
MKQQVPLLSAIAMAAMIATAGAQTAGERYFEGMKRLTEFTGRQDFCLTMARNPLRLRVEGNTLSNMPRTCSGPIIAADGHIRGQCHADGAVYNSSGWLRGATILLELHVVYPVSTCTYNLDMREIGEQQASSR